jgi:hypothetical protein
MNTVPPSALPEGTAGHNVDMALATICPSCGLQGRFPVEWKGRSIECPQCHAVVTLGAPVQPFIQSPPPGAAGNPPNQMFVMTSDHDSATPGGTVAGQIDTIIPLAAPVRQDVQIPEEDVVQPQWIGEETQRFQAYVAKQLAALRHQRHEIVTYQSQQEVKLIGREHDLNQREAILTARAERLQEHEEAVARREAALAHINEELAAREKELRELDGQRAQAEKALADLVHQGDDMRAQTDRLRESMETVRQELLPLEARQRELEVEQAGWSGRVAQWERLQADVEREEQALQRRMAEARELEEQIERELQERARDLDRREQLLQERERKVAQSAPSSPTPAADRSSPAQTRSAHSRP